MLDDMVQHEKLHDLNGEQLMALYDQCTTNAIQKQDLQAAVDAQTVKREIISRVRPVLTLVV